MEHETLKRRTFGSVLWMVAASSWGSVASFVTFAVLARLLDPVTFGTFSLAQSVFIVATTLIASAFNDVVIQRRDLSEELADTLFWTNASLGLFAAGGIWAASDLYSQLVNVPETAPVLRWLALLIPLEVLSAVHLARSLREFGHKIVALRTFASTLIGGGLAIVAALYGMGVWSLVLQAWATSFLTMVFALGAFRWLPRFRFSSTLLISAVPFGSAVMLNRFLYLMSLRIPEMMLGHFWGATAVGYYRVGYRLIELISASALQPIGSVAFATFSSLNGDRARIEAAYLRLLNGGAIISFPLLLGCGVLAEELIRILFGTKWVESAAVVQILCVIAIPQIFSFLIGSALSSTASIKLLNGSAAIQAAATLIFSIIAAPYGLAAVSVAYVARTYAVMPYLQGALYKSSRILFLKCEKVIRPPLISCGAMVAVLCAFRWLIHTYISQDFLYLYVLAMVAIGGLVYASCLYVLDRSTIRTYLKMILERLG